MKLRYLPNYVSITGADSFMCPRGFPHWHNEKMPVLRNLMAWYLADKYVDEVGYED